MDRPNILFVFADQLRGCSLGHVGQERVITPNFDALAGEGVRFTRAVSNIPLCSPMRASMLTGLHPLSHGIVGNDIPIRQDVPSVARSLKGHGYRAGYIGKWHIDVPDRGAFIPPGPRRLGFDDYWAVCNCSHSYFQSFYYRDDPKPIWIDGYEPDHQTDLAIEFLNDAAGRTDPFCLFLSWGPPHCPYLQVPKRFLDMYPHESITPRPNAVNPDLNIIAGYYAHITALDWNFGRLMDALSRTKLDRDTIVVFTSDHGDMLFSHDRGWKCKPWQESVIVPFIARWPGVIPAGRTESAPFGLVDTTPTLLAACGASVPDEMQGTAYPDMLLGRDGPRPESTPIYFYLRAVNSQFGTWRGVVTEQHTYARFADEPWVLYDDAADPYQMTNLCRRRLPSPTSPDCRTGLLPPTSPECTLRLRTPTPALLDRLDAETRRWLERMGDEFETEDDLARRLGIELSESGLPPYYMQPEILAEIHRRAALSPSP